MVKYQDDVAAMALIETLNCIDLVEKYTEREVTEEEYRTIQKTIFEMFESLFPGLDYKNYN